MRKTILLVEDEAILAMTEKMQLEKYGYAVRTVTTGERAVAAVKASSDIDLILMDIDLGDGIDGTEVAEIILKDRAIPVVFLSSHTDPEMVEKTEKITSYGYVVKNSSVTVLDASIKMAFRLFQAHQDLKCKSEELEASNTALRESNTEVSRWQDLLEYIVYHDTSAIAVLDSNLVFRYVSRRFIEDYQIEVPLIGRHHYEAIPDVPEKWRETHRRALRGEVLSSDLDMFPRADGRVDFASWECRPWYESDGSIGGIILYTEVITERVTNEQQFRLLANNSTDFVYRYELLPEPRFSYVSPSATAMTGYTPEDHYLDPYLGMKRVYPDDAHLLAALGTNPESVANPLVLRWVKKDGQVIWAEQSNTPIYDDEGKVIALEGIARDITERKRLEEEFKRFKTISDNAVYGNAIADLQGNLLYVNRFFANIHGYDPENLVGKHFSLFHTEQQMHAAHNLIATMIQKGNFAPTTVWHCHRDGTEFPMLMSGIAIKDVFGNPQFIASSAVDVTEHTQAEEALHQERNLLLSIIDSIPDIIYVKNTEGRKQIVNRADCYKCGFLNKDDLIGKHDFELFPPEIARPFFEDDQRVLKHGEKVVNREEKLIMPTGEIAWQLTTKLPMYDQEGRITGLIGIGRDITDRRQAEQEIQKQLTEKEMLLREVHHRVKNNIANIESLLSLQAGSTTNAGVKAALQDTISRVQSTRVLYDKLLVSEHLDEISIKDYTEGLIDSLVTVFDPEKNVTIKKSIADFEIDAKKAFTIGMVLNEFLTNVFKYAFRDRKNGSVSVSIDKEENKVTLIIRDDGTGFDEKALKNESPGFGLTIVKMLAEQLGGTYCLSNDNGARSVVQFEL